MKQGTDFNEGRKNKKGREKEKIMKGSEDEGRKRKKGREKNNERERRLVGCSTCITPKGRFKVQPLIHDSWSVSKGQLRDAQWEEETG